MKIKRDEKLCSGCRTCQLICAIEHFREVNPRKAAIAIKAEFPDPGDYKIQLCTQCRKCIKECPENAIYEEGGVIRIYAEKCTLCKICVGKCPFKAIFTHNDEPVPIICDLCGSCVEYCPTKALRWQ